MEQSRPWDGIVTGDAGPYSSDDWSKTWNGAFGHGDGYPNVGPFLGTGTPPNDGLRVQAQSPAAAAVDVLKGTALVNGRWYTNTATVALTIAANASGNPRIDTVILRADYSLQTVVLTVLQGTPAASPTPPNLTQVDLTTWEIPLADIAVANGFTSIADTNITPRHEWANASRGVWLDSVLNNSGGTLQTGAPVITDTSANRAANTTTTAQDRRTLGVWVGRTSNGGYGRVLVRGIGYVYSASAVTRGQWIITHTVAAQGTPVDYAATSIVGRALETTSGAGLVLCYVNTRRVSAIDFVHIQDQKTSGTNPASLTAGAWRTRELNTEVVDTGNIASLAANQITLAAGTYVFQASAMNVNAAVTGRLRLRDTTAGTTLIQGTNGTAASSPLSVFGSFTITVQSVIELQQYINSTANGGVSVSSGDSEIYGNVFFWRIGEAT